MRNGLARLAILVATTAAVVASSAAVATASVAINSSVLGEEVAADLNEAAFHAANQQQQNPTTLLQPARCASRRGYFVCQTGSGSVYAKVVNGKVYVYGQPPIAGRYDPTNVAAPVVPYLTAFNHTPSLTAVEVAKTIVKAIPPKTRALAFPAGGSVGSIATSLAKTSTFYANAGEGPVEINNGCYPALADATYSPAAGWRWYCFGGFVLDLKPSGWGTVEILSPNDEYVHNSPDGGSLDGKYRARVW